MDTTRSRRYDRGDERMWDREARHWLALGAVGGLLFTYSCSSGPPSSGGSSQACQTNANCSGSMPKCDDERRVCVECTTNADCDDSEVCSSANTCRRVVACVSRTECPIDLVCDQDAGFCVDCVGDNDCDDSEICSTESQCRTGCDSDKDCQEEGLLCALDDGVCVACVDHVDCDPSEHCHNGNCLPDACDPGHRECAGDELLTCSESGSGFNSETCADGCTGDPGQASCVKAQTDMGTGGAGAGGDTSESSGGSSAGGNSSGGSGGSGGSAGSGGSEVGGAGGSGATESSGGSGGSGAGGSTQCGVPLSIPVTYRDFDASHSDFKPGYESSGVTGVVEEYLSSAGKPVLAGASNTEANIQSAETFAEWYTDGANSATIPGELLLYDDGDGGFVNRYGPNGEPWLSYRNVTQCGTAGANCDQCQVPQGRVCLDPCPGLWGGGSCGATIQQLDGNPLFFPIDGDPELLNDAPEEARIPPDYAAAEWPLESEYLGETNLHNFLFTTEIHIQFAYDASRTQRFSFLGDDDLWVFLNGRLIIDLGGWHVPLAGEFSLDAETVERHGLADGEMYEIAVFHAERQPFGSSFLMRLEGFGEPCD